MMDAFSFHVFAVLIVLVPSSFCDNLRDQQQQQQQTTDTHEALNDFCFLVSESAGSANALQGLLSLSACVRKSDVQSKTPVSHGGVDYEAAVVLSTSDESSMCIKEEDLDRANGSFSFNVAVTLDRNTKPLELTICSIDFETCFRENIALQNNEASTYEGEPITMRVPIYSKNATHVLYKAHLDYCNGDKKPTLIDELMKNSMWKRVRAGRLRRELKKSQESPVNDNVSREKESQQNDGGVGAEDTEKIFDPFDEEGRPGFDFDDDQDVQWVKRREPVWRQASLARNNVGIQDGSYGQEKRKWKNTGMGWMKKRVGSGYEDYEEVDSDESDDENLKPDGEYGADIKRKWGKSSPMGWMKRKWGNAAMGWMKRNEDKRKWRNSGMQWTKK